MHPPLSNSRTLARSTQGLTLIELTVVVAIVSVLIGAALLFLDPLATHVAGYVIGCLVPFTAVALSRREDVRLRGEQGLIAPNWRRGAYLAIIVLGFAVAGAHAWAIAWDVARQVQL